MSRWYVSISGHEFLPFAPFTDLITLGALPHEMPIEPADDEDAVAEESRLLAATVDELILQALVSPEVPPTSAGSEVLESLSTGQDTGSGPSGDEVAESNSSRQLRDMLEAVRVSD